MSSLEGKSDTIKSPEEIGKDKGKVEALILVAKSGVVTGEQFDQIYNAGRFPPLSLDEEWDIEKNSSWNRKERMLELVDELQERDGSSFLRRHVG